MPESIKIIVGKSSVVKKKLKIRKSLSGDLMIFDHVDIDIVVQPGAKKIVTFPKAEFGDHIYGAQDRFFKFLAKKGVVLPESIRAGNVFNALEAVYQDTMGGGDSTQLVLLAIADYLEQEKPYFEAQKEYEKAERDKLLDPDESDSTELGDVSQESTKGTITQPYRPSGGL